MPTLWFPESTTRIFGRVLGFRGPIRASISAADIAAAGSTLVWASAITGVTTNTADTKATILIALITISFRLRRNNSSTAGPVEQAGLREAWKVIAGQVWGTAESACSPIGTASSVVWSYG